MSETMSERIVEALRPAWFSTDYNHREAQNAVRKALALFAEATAVKDAEIAELRTKWCVSCGSHSKDGSCDCTQGGNPEWQRLVMLGDEAHRLVVSGMDDGLKTAEAQLAEAKRVLEPFADFADARGIVSPEHVITQGSPMAKRQLTMADCLAARAFLAKLGAG